MISPPLVDLIIPAFNEQPSIAKVIREIPMHLLREVIVVDNNSHDDTAQAARSAGATVLSETRPGYGSACLKGLAYVQSKPEPPHIVAFMDADYSDFPQQLSRLLAPIQNGTADLVIGSRALGSREAGSMTLPQRFGNRLAVVLIQMIYGEKFTDLGPFRAISYPALLSLKMSDTNYGWTVEMQIKAIRKSLRCTEVAVDYRQRIGISKVSGTLRGVVGAGYKILYTIFKYAWLRK
jgi:glycosyltransferase involved in cell wall biosynthesis